MSITPIFWNYYQDKELGECRFYQVAVNYALVQVKDGKRWIDKEKYLEKYKELIGDIKCRKAALEEFIF